MINATDLKAGTTFLMNSKPFRVIKYSHQKIARGGGTVKLTVRNLENGNLDEMKISSTKKLEEIKTIKKQYQFLYSDDYSGVFMDSNNYEQIEVAKSLIDDKLTFLREGDSVDILFWDQRALSIDIADKVTLKVAETDPGVKGNSATNIFKTAKLESGKSIKVPLFINRGDLIRVDTKTGEYVERAK